MITLGWQGDANHRKPGPDVTFYTGEIVDDGTVLAAGSSGRMAEGVPNEHRDRTATAFGTDTDSPVMAQVCLLGKDGEQLRYELLSRETAREALTTYDLREPYENTLALETVSIGAAVALLNDLNWYVVRFVSDALVQSDSVSETEWLSRELAAAVRDGEMAPDETGAYLRLYGVEENRLVDPIHARREDVAGERGSGENAKAAVPEREDYDELLVVRVTESEFQD